MCRFCPETPSRGLWIQGARSLFRGLFACLSFMSVRSSRPFRVVSLSLGVIRVSQGCLSGDTNGFQGVGPPTVTARAKGPQRRLNPHPRRWGFAQSPLAPCASAARGARFSDLSHTRRSATGRLNALSVLPKPQWCARLVFEVSAPAVSVARLVCPPWGHFSPGASRSDLTVGTSVVISPSFEAVSNGRVANEMVI